MKPAEETTEPTAVVALPTEDAAKVDETPAPVVAQEKPKPAKRASIFGNFVEKLKSPTTEKKESEAALAPATVKETETPEAAKPLEEAEVAAPVVPEAAATETTEPKPVAAVSTPGKEKEHFSFGKLFGSKDRAKSPAPESKVDAAAPKIEDASAAPVVAEPTPVEAAPVAAETKPEETTPATEAPKADKRKSFFGNLSRSLSKATGGKTQPKEKKEAASPAPVVEEESAAAAPVVEEKKEETAVPAVGDVPAENISVGDASKSANPTVATTA